MTDRDAILITGPTASGKSRLAMELAARHGGVVVNADSMQVYDTLRVVTARPSAEDEAAVPHALYGHVPAAASYSTGEWLRAITPLLAQLRAEGSLPVIVGGTGLYFKALTGGLSVMPDVPEAVRASLRARLEEEGAAAIHAALAAVDPVTAARLNPNDAQRILRALEVYEASGRPISVFQSERGPAIIDPDRADKRIVLPDRAVLQARIDRRFETMMDEGAIEEVRALLALDLPPSLPAMKAIGVPEITALLQGRLTRADATRTASAATRA